MQLFKQIITRKYQKYLTHSFNNRFFPHELYQAQALALVIMNVEHQEPIDYDRYHTLSRLHKYTYDNIVRDIAQRRQVKGQELDEFQKARQELLRATQEPFVIQLRKAATDDADIISSFLNIYKDVKVIEEPPIIDTSIPGIIAVEYPHLNYEKAYNRR